MNILPIMAASAGASATVLPEGVDLDGTYDYFSRSSDLVGNIDSKTFTFSCWVYVTSGTIERGILQSYGKNVEIRINSSNNLEIIFLDATGSPGIGCYSTNAIKIATNSFLNILVSCDTSNTSKRHVVINDVIISVTWNWYVNSFIDFTPSTNGFSIGSYFGANKLKGRLSHLFLDYTYRDLSIEANRRLFITADGKPADWNTTKALNGILMLQMKDAATAHINDGYGGNMVQNGTLDTAGRGANQDNCVASYFDGVADYLSATSITGISNSKTATLNFDFLLKDTNQKYFINFGSSNGGDNFTCYATGGGGFSFFVKNTAGVVIGGFTYTPTGGIVVSKNYRVSISIDLSDTNKRNVILNGTIIPVTWSTYTNDFIMLTGFATPRYRIATDGDATPLMLGNLGELYFDTKYIDLATSNPFWDSVENKPKTVRQVIRETGVTPLIAMPLDASNAGKNYGTGGDFTANSAPYVGARGASEFWARSAKFDGTTGYLSRGVLAGASDSKTLSFVSYFNPASTSIVSRIIGLSNGTSVNLLIYLNTDNKLYITAKNSAGTIIISGSTDSTIATVGLARIVEYSLDTTNQSASLLYLSGVNYPITYTVFTNDFIDITVTTVDIGAIYNGTHNGFFNGTQALCYLTTDYIDFSQEVNRNKFVDQLGYPKDLKAQIDAGVIPKPLFYLPFDDVSNLGKDASGNGNHFTVVGTVTAGADVLG